MRAIMVIFRILRAETSAAMIIMAMTAAILGFFLVYAALSPD